MSITFIHFFSNNLFIPQSIKNPLWVSCINKTSFLSVCKELNFDWNRLKQLGFNVNFLTRDRWLDIDILFSPEKLNLTIDILQRELKLTQSQIDLWNLTEKEKEKVYKNVQCGTRQPPFDLPTTTGRIEFRY